MTAPVPPVGVEYLVTWLRAHQGEFTEEALRGRLLGAGHSPADVDAALSMLHAEGSRLPEVTPRATAGGTITSPPPPPSEPSHPGDPVLAFLGAALGIVGIPYLLAVAGSGNLALLVGGAAILLALVGWGVLRDSSRPGIARGLGAALVAVVVLPFVAVVGLFGYCLVTGGRLY